MRKCWRKCSPLEGFYHMWWMCPRNNRFCKKAGDMVREISGCQLSYNPLVFLLNLPKNSATYKSQEELITHLPMAARIITTKAGRELMPPKITEWFQKFWEQERENRCLLRNLVKNPGTC